ncbi:MAG: hypothetical protein ACXVBF_07280 [Flavisolibacter sp.]
MSDIIIVIILIMPVVLVIIALNYTHKKRKRKAREELGAYLDQLSKEHRIQSGFRKKLIHQLVMIDRTSAKMIVVNEKDNQFSHEIFSMDAIKSMKVITVKQAIPLDDGSRKTEIITTQVGVEISFTRPEKEILLVSYDHRDQSIFQMAEMETEARQLHEDISRYRTPELMSA